MKFTNIFCATAIVASMATVSAQEVHAGLKRSVEAVYSTWRVALQQKHHGQWKSATAEHRQITIYNRLVSERKPYPASVFKMPMAPPSVQGLKAINVNMKGSTAIASYFGKIDFGIGGAPSENLMLLYFVGEKGQWKFDKAEYIMLSALADVRKQMLAGDYSYAKQKDFMASGVVPELPKQITKRGYIAKVYVYCPGREVKVNVNKGMSKHRFQNDKRAEVLIGGAFDGNNPITFETKSLPGSTGKEPMDIRVFLMSQIEGVKPVNVFQYRITPEDITAGKRPAEKSDKMINITAEHVKGIMTKP